MKEYVFTELGYFSKQTCEKIKKEVNNMEENKIRKALEENGIKMSEFARAEEIPLRTFHNWCYGERKPAPYLERWCIEKIEEYAKKKAAE